MKRLATIFFVVFIFVEFILHTIITIGISLDIDYFRKHEKPHQFYDKAKKTFAYILLAVISLCLALFLLALYFTKLFENVSNVSTLTFIGLQVSLLLFNLKFIKIRNLKWSIIELLSVIAGYIILVFTTAISKYIIKDVPVSEEIQEKMDKQRKKDSKINEFMTKDIGDVISQ